LQSQTQNAFPSEPKTSLFPKGLRQMSPRQRRPKAEFSVSERLLSQEVSTPPISVEINNFNELRAF
jgi:hypothetical protein